MGDLPLKFRFTSAISDLLTGVFKASGVLVTIVVFLLFEDGVTILEVCFGVVCSETLEPDLLSLERGGVKLQSILSRERFCLVKVWCSSSLFLAIISLTGNFLGSDRTILT